MTDVKGANPGSPKSSAHLRDFAQEALAMLFDLAKAAESEAVRVSAIKELLERGLGKAGAAPDAAEPPLTRIERVIVDPRNAGLKNADPQD